MIMRGTLAFVTAFLLTVSSDCQTNPEVTTGQGTVRGLTMTTIHGRNFSAFLGIPYALPPVGDLRFKNPVAADPWNGSYDATKDSLSCAQIGSGIAEWEDEDCLYLNLYTPKLPKDEDTSLLPVMFHIYGGGFQGGVSSSDVLGPHYILDKDVVMVSPNYRVGVLGFLSTGDANAPGNFGLKDQVMALRWVQENVKDFGGDPDKVTIFGSSAGASSVYYHTLSDLSNGLFHRYIVQSGPLIGPLYKESSACIGDANRLGKHFGCSTNKSSLLIDCLRKVRSSAILNTASIFNDWDELPKEVWVPTDEPDLEGAFITDSPFGIDAAGKRKDLPFIAGLTRDDGILETAVYYLNEEKFDRFLNDFEKALPLMVGRSSQLGDVENYVAALQSQYLNTKLTSNRNMLLSNFTDLITDIYCLYPLINLHEQQLSLMQSPSYLYSFEYRGSISYSYGYSKGNTSDFGVVHGDELIYLFPPSELHFPYLNLRKSGAEMEMVDVMVQLWTSFAANGKPTTLDANTADIWKPFSSDKNYLRIGNGSKVALSVGFSLHEDRLKFWRDLAESLTI